MARCLDAIDGNRLGDVLDRPGPEFIEAEGKLALHLVVDAAGEEDVAGLGHCLEPHGDDDAVPEEVATFDDNITEIDADAQDDMPILGKTFVRGRHPRPEVNGKAHGIDRAGELDQNAIPHQLDDTAMMVADEGFQDSLAPLVERGQRTLLVQVDQPAVADHVGCHDCCQSSLRSRR